MDTRCVQELNQLLKGTHMGASLFEDLKGKANDPALIRLIDDCLQRLRRHQELLEEQVRMLEGEPAMNGGFFQGISEMVEKIRTFPIEADVELAKECIQYMESGLQALNQFEQKQYVLEPMVQRSLGCMRDDYQISYHSFHQYVLQHARS